MNLMNIICNGYKNAIISFNFIFYLYHKGSSVPFPFSVEFACSACVYLGSLQAPQLPPDMHIRLISNSKLSIGI